MPVELSDPEDAKLLTLARASRARAGSTEAAAVRDSDGRTYSATNVDLPTLQLTALQVAVAMAISSGVTGLEAALVVTDQMAVEGPDVTVIRQFAGTGVPVHRADSSGAVLETVTT
jgi:cytidine deaminase